MTYDNSPRGLIDQLIDEAAHRSPKVHRDPPTSPPIDYHQMADDYGGISSIAFNAKYGADWYERHHEALEAEFRRRFDPDPLTVEPEPLDPRVPVHEPHQPAPLPWVGIGCGLFAGIWLAAVVLLLAASLDATPQGEDRPTVTWSSAGADMPDVGLLPGAPLGVTPLWQGTVTASPAGLGGAPLPAVALTEPLSGYGGQPVESTPAPFGEVGTARYACRGTDAAVDLSPAAFEQLAPLSRGRIAVAIEVLTWPGDGPPPHPDDERMRIEVRDDEVYR